MVYATKLGIWASMDDFVLANGSGVIFGLGEKEKSKSVNNFWNSVGAKYFVVVFVLRVKVTGVGINRNNSFVDSDSNDNKRVLETVKTGGVVASPLFGLGDFGDRVKF